MAGSKPLPEAARLRELFTLNEATGELFWKPRLPSDFKAYRRSAEFEAKHWNRRFAGLRAGFQRADGYWVVRINKVAFKAHRIVFAMMHGYDPGERQIDHRDRVRSNNIPDNLRMATQTENQWNRGPQSRGLKGVTFRPQTGKWQARIRFNGRLIVLGCYDTPDAAHATYRCVANILHGKFSRAQ